MFLTEGDVAALRAAAVNKEATLSAHTVSLGSRGDQQQGDASHVHHPGDATLPAGSLSGSLSVLWRLVNAMPPQEMSSRADLQTPGAPTMCT